jgi:site-specific DNA recombinase
LSARTLNADGLRTRAGKLFGTTIINYWLRNPAYIGRMVWNRTDRTNEKPLRKSAEEVIVISNAHEALVSTDDFERVQVLLSDRRPVVRHPRSVASPYLLSGFSYCGSCGSAMIGSAAKSGKYLYYECNTHFKKGKEGCVGFRVAKSKLEEFVMGRIKENILTEDNLTELVHLVNEELIETANRHEKELQQTEKQLAQVCNKLNRLYVALESGKLELDDLAPRIKELRANQQDLQQRRDFLLSKIESKTPETLDTAVVMGYARELGQVLEQASFLQQKTFLRSFVKRIEVNPQTVVLEYTIPLPLEKNRTSTREVLDINRIGSGGWI